MEVVYPRCAGLDVHKKSVVVCVLISTSRGQPEKQSRSFGTMTDELLELSDWLTELGVTHLAMESTGVYWKPLWNILEGSFELLLANAQRIKLVPGRKTDVKDAEWIAELLRHGLLSPSFVPPRPQRELRELTRYRTALIRERSAEVNRLQKILEGGNIKLGSVVSDVVGVSARAMLAQLIAGETDTQLMAELAKGRMRDKIALLERALTGRLGTHQRFLLARQLEHIDFLDEAVARVSQEVAERVGPFEEAVELLDTIPGVGRKVAEGLVAEIGVDMGRWPSAKHLGSWAKLSPGNNESGGKRRSGQTGKGNPWLKSALVEAAQAVSHTNDNYLAAQYHRLAARRGKKKAVVAVAHSILVIAYHVLKREEPYRDLGAQYYDQRDRLAIEKRLVSRLERLGNKVTLEPLELTA